MTGTAIPPWLIQIAPKWFIERPDFFEFVYAFFVAFGMGTTNVLYTIWVTWAALTPQAEQTLPAYLGVVGRVWFSIAAPLFWAYVRGRKAQQKAVQSTTP